MKKVNRGFTFTEVKAKAELKSKHSGFTLVELLVVIAIIAILAAVVVLIVNPLEMTRRSRDAARMADLQNLQQAINISSQENSTTAWFLCGGTDPDPATECTGNSGVANSRSNDGSGWVKVNLASQAVRVPTLPIDPSNDVANDLIYYYVGSEFDWEINAQFESQQYTVTDNKPGNDGGGDPSWYEVGSDLGLRDVES